MRMLDLTHGSLFSGIGGIDLGFERAGIRTVWQVEIDDYCRRILARQFPAAQRFSDIRECGRRNLCSVDVLSGGFPCQDISNAGKMVGIGGEKSGLWKEMLRIVCELRPPIVTVENVAALLGRGMGTVLGDLAAAGYDCEWDCVPLGAFGAHFLRDRVFIIAFDPVSCSLRPQRSRPRPIGTWSEQQFEGLLRDQIQLAVPAGRFGRISVRVPARMDRLWGLGDSVSPIQAEWIGKRIVEHAERLLESRAIART